MPSGTHLAATGFSVRGRYTSKRGAWALEVELRIREARKRGTVQLPVSHISQGLKKRALLLGVDKLAFPFRASGEVGSNRDVVELHEAERSRHTILPYALPVSDSLVVKKTNDSSQIRLCIVVPSANGDKIGAATFLVGVGYAWLVEEPRGCFRNENRHLKNTRQDALPMRRFVFMYAHEQDGMMVGNTRKEHNHRKPVIGKVTKSKPDGADSPKAAKRGRAEHDEGVSQTLM
ncbi:hypothetical protein EDD85DRAFT_793370 [Armillaria nabsnona]|nr:hypothetical protein EDD85DRAFT_793370 [Armillaria nabsnona]